MKESLRQTPLFEPPGSRWYLFLLTNICIGGAGGGLARRPLMECDNMTTGSLARWHTPVIIVTVVNILSSSGQILMTLRIVVVNVRHN